LAKRCTRAGNDAALTALFAQRLGPRRADRPGCAIGAIDTALHEIEARLRFSTKAVWGELAAL
jgi:hypothetical protein